MKYKLVTSLVNGEIIKDLLDRLLQNADFSHFSIFNSLKLWSPFSKKLSFVTACRFM